MRLTRGNCPCFIYGSSRDKTVTSRWIQWSERKVIEAGPRAPGVLDIHLAWAAMGLILDEAGNQWPV